MCIDARLSSPAVLRNREPILEVLREILPPAGTILEIASGSGEHVVHFAEAFPDLGWQPSDPSAQARASIAAWIASGKPPNIFSPLNLDATAETWPLNRADAVIAINMVHISPWPATLGLLRHSARLLRRGAPLFLYGPYRQQGEEMAPSNAAFDAQLRDRDGAWGIRSLDDVTRAAGDAGFRLARFVAMPAHNLSVVFERG